MTAIPFNQSVGTLQAEQFDGLSVPFSCLPWHCWSRSWILLSQSVPKTTQKRGGGGNGPILEIDSVLEGLYVRVCTRNHLFFLLNHHNWGSRDEMSVPKRCERIGPAHCGLDSLFFLEGAFKLTLMRSSTCPFEEVSVSHQ